MAKYEVAVPLPEEQHSRNPKWKWTEEQVTDPKPGKVSTVRRKERIVKDTKADGIPIYEVGGEPIWGLGCPAGCGRFWEFTADSTFEDETTDADGVKRKWRRGESGCHFRPCDPAAYSGIDEDGNPIRGYLNFRPDPDTPSTVKSFECDRCGAEVRLVRR